MNKEAGKILEEARKKRGLTQSEAAALLAESLGQTYSQRQYQKLEDGNFPKFKTDIVKGVDQLFGLKLYTLIYEQNVPRETAEELKPSFLEQRRQAKIKNQPYMVPFIPVKAQAGYVKAVDQEVFMDTLEKYALPPGVNPHGAVWAYWEVEGDSMEPVFRSGDVILTSLVHPMDWQNLRNFYTYVIVTRNDNGEPGRVLIKRIYCKNDLEWVLISENEDQYPQQLLPVEYVKEVWVYRRTWKSDASPSKQFEIKV